MDLLNVELMKVIMSIVMIEADMITNVNIPETSCLHAVEIQTGSPNTTRTALGRDGATEAL